MRFNGIRNSEERNTTMLAQNPVTQMGWTIWMNILITRLITVNQKLFFMQITTAID